jgi:putative ATPase
MVIFASEDIGLAAPAALNLAVSTFLAVERIGLPEGRYNLFHCATVLSKAPKSRAVSDAMYQAVATARDYPDLPVPLHLRNAPTKLMKDLDYGKDYQYAHDIEGKVAGMDCLPESLRDRRYYHPTSEGREKLLKQRMEEIERIREENRKRE